MHKSTIAIVALLATTLSGWGAAPALGDAHGRNGRVEERHPPWGGDRGAGHRRHWIRWDHVRRPPPWAGHRIHSPHHARWGRDRGPMVFFGAHLVPWDREFIGSILGGAAGGVLGSHIGRGSGNAAAIVGGAVIGALVGGSVGRSMDAVDRLYVAQTLEYTPTRKVVAWQNPDSRSRFEVEPLGTYQRKDGRYCREYRTTAVIGGETHQIYGTACRQPDGSWEVVR